MNESGPSPVGPGQSNPSSFPRWLAIFSIIAPLAAILIGLLLNLPIPGILPAKIGLGLLLVLSGLVSAIIAMVVARKHGQTGIFGKALVGICLNGLLLLLIPVAIILPLFLVHGQPTTPQGRLDNALKELTATPSGEKRFYALDDAAKESYEAGKVEEARKYATELLTLAPNYKGDWNYGNAIQDGNLVLGRIALREGKTEEAKQFLIEAGKIPGSPQMNSFGPNMSLANDLLGKGEKDVVLQYFQLCRKFWKMDYGKLNDWSKEVNAGNIPDFGANLVY